MTLSLNRERNSREVVVGNTPLGGAHPIRIQSMAKTDTRDVPATVQQCQQAFDTGAHYMRISIPDTHSLKALEKIKNKLVVSGYHQPLIADIHYSSDLAEKAAGVAEKIRINPANFGSSPVRHAHYSKQNLSSQYASGRANEQLMDNLAAVTRACKKHGTAIRLGGNTGSLRTDQREGHSQRGSIHLINKMSKYIDIMEELDFRDIVISIKASHPAETVEASRLMYRTLQQSEKNYPLHIGVTESGMGLSGRISSALGILPLLQDGIADTIRVSLTEKPVHEIAFAKHLLQSAGTRFLKTCKSEVCNNILEMSTQARDTDALVSEAVSTFLAMAGKPNIHHITIEAPNITDQRVAEEVALLLMEHTGISSAGTRFISCPACARTSTDMEELCRVFRKELAGFPGITIAIMGCMVNGPGEMAVADYGVIASSKGKVNVFKSGRSIRNNATAEEAVDLIKLSLSEKSR